MFARYLRNATIRTASRPTRSPPPGRPIPETDRRRGWKRRAVPGTALRTAGRHKRTPRLPYSRSAPRRAVVTPTELRREIAGHERTGIGGALRSDQHRLPDGQSAAGIRPRDPGKDQQLRVAIADRRHCRHSAAIRADPGDPDFGPVGGTVAERRYFRLRRTQYDDLFVLHGKRF